MTPRLVLGLVTAGVLVMYGAAIWAIVQPHDPEASSSMSSTSDAGGRAR